MDYRHSSSNRAYASRMLGRQLPMSQLPCSPLPLSQGVPSCTHTAGQEPACQINSHNHTHEWTDLMLIPCGQTSN
jgi:hypothetical protein